MLYQSVSIFTPHSRNYTQATRVQFSLFFSLFRASLLTWFTDHSGFFRPFLRFSRGEVLSAHEEMETKRRRSGNLPSVTERCISLRFHPILTHLIFDTSSSLLCVFTRSTRP